MALIEIYLRDADHMLLINLISPQVNEQEKWRWQRTLILQREIAEGYVPPSTWWDEVPKDSEPIRHEDGYAAQLAWHHLKIRIIWPLFGFIILYQMWFLWRR